MPRVYSSRPSLWHFVTSWEIRGIPFALRESLEQKREKESERKANARHVRGISATEKLLIHAERTKPPEASRKGDNSRDLSVEPSPKRRKREGTSEFRGNSPSVIDPFSLERLSGLEDNIATLFTFTNAPFARRYPHAANTSGYEQESLMTHEGEAQWLRGKRACDDKPRERFCGGKEEVFFSLS